MLLLESNIMPACCAAPEVATNENKFTIPNDPLFTHMDNVHCVPADATGYALLLKYALALARKRRDLSIR
jgi:hypothetical protein